MAEEAMVSIIFHKREGSSSARTGRNISSPLSPMNGGFMRQETNGWEGDLQHVLYINYGAGDVSSDPDAAASVII
ncbi:unnamed protein product [Brassica rapa subsp. trilocularis]